ncbi:hypothetical protein BGW38_003546 [Lunasporangiospora selenospora]|uniref:Uncharacterized protein n=1 Tax=Lunasporangiospora selenospora TaxID=979761 RepID=A0A9P6FQG2_9FUNG|nr:hypothetical protein BGW38_003546 [Lunasporangiospora selenospora]
MVPRRRNLVLCAVTASALAWCSMLTVEALPIDRLMLSSALSSVVYHRYRHAIPLSPYSDPLEETGPNESLNFGLQPTSHGRAQIRSILQREQQARDIPDHHATYPNVNSRMDHDQDSSSNSIGNDLPLQHPVPIHSVVSQPGEQTILLPSESLPLFPRQPMLSSSSLEGHAVLDDDDDDAGNELMDTEGDGFVPPDAEDEFEGSIEPEAYEEEEEEDEDDEDNGFDQDNDEEEDVEGELGYEDTLAYIDRFGVADQTTDLSSLYLERDRGDSKEEWSAIGTPETEEEEEEKKEEERAWSGIVQRLQSAMRGMPKSPDGRVQRYQEQDHEKGSSRLDRASSLLTARLRAWQAAMDESLLVEKGYHDSDEALV